MRRLMLSLALGVAALGVLATSPGSAKAFWPVSVVGARSANGYGIASVAGLPTMRVQTNGFGVTKTIYSPGAYRSVFTPQSVSRLWYGSSFTTNPVNGQTMQSGCHSMMGFVFSPYAGFRSVNQKSATNISSSSALPQYSRYIGINSSGSFNNSNTGAGTSMHLSGTKLYGTPLYGTPLYATQLHGTPLYGTALSGTPLYGTPLPGGMHFYGSPLPDGIHLYGSPFPEGIHAYGTPLPPGTRLYSGTLPGNWAFAYRSHVFFAINL